MGRVLINPTGTHHATIRSKPETLNITNGHPCRRPSTSQPIQRITRHYLEVGAVRKIPQTYQTISRVYSLETFWCWGMGSRTERGRIKWPQKTTPRLEPRRQILKRKIFLDKTIPQNKAVFYSLWDCRKDWTGFRRKISVIIVWTQQYRPWEKKGIRSLAALKKSLRDSLIKALRSVAIGYLAREVTREKTWNIGRRFCHSGFVTPNKAQPHTAPHFLPIKKRNKAAVISIIYRGVKETMIY